MRKRVTLCLRVAWTVAALVSAPMVIAICDSSNQACRPAGDTMLWFMAILSFPAGLVCVILSAIVRGLAAGEFPSPYITGWLLLECGGCLQWYLIVPILLEEPKLTLLNLNSFSVPSKIATAGVSANSPIEAAQTLAAPLIKLPRKRRKRKRHHRVVGFDKFGRTPLERIIHRHSTDASA